MDDAEHDEHGANAATTAAAAPASDAGWLEIEQTIGSMELPPVPPTSDPQRLLGYVLTILPKYTEMELLATHLRLYVAALEQEMEHVRSHVSVLGREVETEREKKQFLERYAAQVVKERNELLHAKGSSAKSKANSATHFAWHTCCKKNATHSLDLTPSIATFRGEKLDDAMRHIQRLQVELQSVATQRRDVDYLLKKTQREHDSKRAADRQHVRQLERQLQQRAMLTATIERKLYDVERALAQHDDVHSAKVEKLQDQYKATTARAVQLEDANTALSDRICDLESQIDALDAQLEDATDAKRALAERVDSQRELLDAAAAETDALQAEIAILQTTDLQTVRSEYAARIDKLQREAAAREHQLQRDIDALRRALLERQRDVAADDTLAQLDVSAADANSDDDDNANGDGQGVAQSAASDLRDNGRQSAVVTESARHTSVSERPLRERSVGSSLSRSQLSESSVSLAVSEPSRQASSRSESVMRRLFESHDGDENDGVDGQSSDGSRDSHDSHDSHKSIDRNAMSAAASSSNTSVFDWESFLDSPSECATPDPKRARHIPALPDTRLTSSVAHSSRSSHRADPISDDVGDATREFEQLHLIAQDAAADRLEDEHDVASDISGTGDSNDVLTRECYSDEEKDEEEEDDALSPAAEQPATNDLAVELRKMLQGLARRRVEEEHKAERVTTALAQFQQTLQ